MDIQVRNLTKKDYVDLRRSMTEAYQGVGDVWTRENIVDLIDMFPEGQLCVEIDGHVVACALSIILNSKKVIYTIVIMKLLMTENFQNIPAMATRSMV
ncbi:hypothetical protein L950_0210045 [Sphingobacterium sp. IITKGP-BTPF85]|nr:hypothetical protein L950_0210045 [Sphingobacterium sp. IITKGP-BTPF85]